HAHGAARLRLGRTALHLDQAHAAVAGNGQPLVEAEARDFRTRLLSRLEQRVMVGDLYLFPVDLELSHYLSPAVVAPLYAAIRSGTLMPLIIMPSTSAFSIFTLLMFTLEKSVFERFTSSTFELLRFVLPKVAADRLTS